MINLKSKIAGRLGVILFGFSWLWPDVTAANGPDIAAAIAVICKVDKEGQGHADAVEAMQVLNQASAADIPVLLAGMDQANPLARNWLRGAVERAAQSGGAIPMVELRKYFDDRSRSSLGRLLAFDLLTESNQALSQEIIPTLIDDPSLPLRRKAIDYFIDKASQQKGAEAIGLLAFALANARETDQVTKLREELAKYNVQIDLTRQMGFISKWHLAGPFEHANEANFNTALGPELNLDAIDLKAEFDGKPDGDKPRRIKWIAVETSDPNGVVNVNDHIGKVKGAITYAYAEFKSESDQPVSIRCGCINGTKVWVNGELLINEEVYHVGMDPDQYMANAKLKKGLNQIVIKICQNEQTEPWAQEWMFQLRICDETGKAILAAAEPQPQ